MAIANAKVTAGQTYTSGDTVTSTNLNALGLPTIGLSPTGDIDTGLSSPSANILGIETNGTERARFTSGGLAMTGNIFDIANNGVLKLNGGSAVDTGAGIVLYGGAHATLADDGAIRMDECIFTDQSGGTQYASISGSGLALGATGSAIKAIWTGTVNISETDLAADGLVTDTTTITGAADGDIVFVQIPLTGFSGYFDVQGYVSAGDTVTVSTHNRSASARSMTTVANVIVFDIT